VDKAAHIGLHHLNLALSAGLPLKKISAGWPNNSSPHGILLVDLCSMVWNTNQ